MANAGSKAEYDVGYGKPPAAHRFQKGRSGNPSGRAKGSKNKVPVGQGLDFGAQPANRMLLEEAYRTISVREGDRTTQLPVIKAVFRALGVAAMKGNRLAQTTMAELVRGIEEEDRQIRVEHYATAIDYKTDWEREIERARRLGLPEPQPLPHPDDVIIDVRTAAVHYAGPMTPEEKRRWDRALKFRDEQQEFVSLAAGLYHQANPDNEQQRAERLATWQSAQAVYDRISAKVQQKGKSGRAANDPIADHWLSGNGLGKQANN